MKCQLPPSSILLLVLALTGLPGGGGAPQAAQPHNITRPTGRSDPRPAGVARSPGGDAGSTDSSHVAGSGRPLVEGVRATLTKMDLAQLPVDNKTYHLPKPRYPQLGCKTLQSKMQISDGFCTSIEPVKSVICEGNCLPEQDLPWFAQFMKLWGRTKVIDYVCEDDVVRRKKVELVCENGEIRKIRIKVVRSCKCSRLVEPANRPLAAKHRYSTKVVDGKDDRKGKELTNRKHRRRKHRGRKRRKDKRRRKDRARAERRRNKKGTKLNSDERAGAQL